VGPPLDGSTVTHRFQAALQRLGLPRLRFHDLRHTCATLLKLEGEQDRTIMDLLGHSQIQVTLNTYAHVLPEMRQSAASKIDRVLAPSSPVATSVATMPNSNKVN
jgi:integrase